jgi:hypothetical protein
MHTLLRAPRPARLRQVTGLALLATVLLYIVFGIHDRPLAPFSIVSYELAFTPARALAMFNAWGEAGRRVARESLLIDFAFMPAYALALGGLALAEARLAAGQMQRIGLAITLAPVMAAVFDVVENLALLAALSQPAAPSAGMLLVAGVCAVVKFALIIAAVVYIAAASAGRLRRAARSSA